MIGPAVSSLKSKMALPKSRPSYTDKYTSDSPLYPKIQPKISLWLTGHIYSAKFLTTAVVLSSVVLAVAGGLEALGGVAGAAASLAAAGASAIVASGLVVPSFTGNLHTLFYTPYYIHLVSLH